MGHSKRCKDLTTYWNRTVGSCVPCGNIQIPPGHEMTPNCGWDDDGGRHETPTRPCLSGTFNEGNWKFCRPCRTCGPGEHSSGQCGPKHDIQCFSQEPGGPNMTLTTPTPGVPNDQTTEVPQHDVPWVIPLTITLSVTFLLVLLAFCIYLKWKQGFIQGQTVLRFNRRSSAGFSSLSAPPDHNDLNDILSPDILSLPLHTVLNELDILEELMILLDPESQRMKNTKHLASYCSFPSTWITYTYSMKDSKSPLQAVLEAVTCRHPEWTVGHLARMLRLMQRNDAIAVLAKLKRHREDVEEAVQMEQC